jgi:hypothetical protein
MGRIHLDQRGTYWTAGNLLSVSSFSDKKFVGDVVFFSFFFKNSCLRTVLLTAKDQLASKQTILKGSLSEMDLSFPEVSSYNDK